MVVERQTGQVKAYVGSADYASEERKGANNYLTAIRSPGSTLKPLIYGKALQRNLISFDHVFDDKEFYRGGYTPTNFDNTFSGKVTLKDALIRSLNIPALNALEKVGPEVFESELTTLLGNALTEDQNAGLSLAVGGYYLSAEQLIDLYLKAFDPNTASKLTFVNEPSEVISESDAPLLIKRRRINCSTFLFKRCQTARKSLSKQERHTHVRTLGVCKYMKTIWS